MLDLDELRFKIASMTYSFSRLKSFCQCPYEWYLHYIKEGDPPEDNFFTQYGKLMHSIIEKYANGDLQVFELMDYYEEHFGSEVTFPAPYNKSTDLRESYFNKGKMYIDSLISIDLNDYEIVAVELEIEFKIHDKDFTGFIDMLLRNKITGEIVMVDHKSTGVKFKKDGEVSKTNMNDIMSFKKQMYIYSVGIHNKLGVYPSSYIVNLFNVGKLYEYKFNQDEFDDSIKWAIETINQIEKTTEFRPNPDLYYCRNLCGYRNKFCEYKK